MPDFKAPESGLAENQRPVQLPSATVGNETAQMVERERATQAGVVSFLSSTERRGRWQLPRRFRALAVMGNIELDLRQAEIGYGISVIEAVAIMGNVEVRIPPDVAVECDGDSFMGTFTLKYEGRASPSMANRERTIRVTGTAYAGSVAVSVKVAKEDFPTRLTGSGRRRR